MNSAVSPEISDLEESYGRKRGQVDFDSRFVGGSFLHKSTRNPQTQDTIGYDHDPL